MLVNGVVAIDAGTATGRRVSDRGALGLGVAFFPGDVPGFAEPEGGMHGGGGESMRMMP